MYLIFFLKDYPDIFLRLNWIVEQEEKQLWNVLWFAFDVQAMLQPDSANLQFKPFSHAADEVQLSLWHG